MRSARRRAFLLPKTPARWTQPGKFMIPGLWDMHVHWYEKDYLSLFIANGVTAVRLMWGMPLHHAWRNAIENGTLIGPRMSIASPIIDGPNPIWPMSVSVTTATEARSAVRTFKRQGADFIKIYNLLPREAFFAIADETKKQGITLVGHVPRSVSVVEASDAGQKSIEHLGGVLQASSSREEEIRKEIETLYANLPRGRNVPSPAQLRPTSRMTLDTFSAEKADNEPQKTSSSPELCTGNRSKWSE